PTSLVASAVLTMAAATSDASQSGCACMVSAALPATCGAAIEVPDMNTPWLPVPMPVEKMLTPGAEMSGFKWPSPPRGPAELKDANRPKVGLANVLAVSVAPVEVARITAAGRVAGPCTPSKGMLTGLSKRVPG